MYASCTVLARLHTLTNLQRVRCTGIEGETASKRPTHAISNMPHTNRVIFIYDCDLFTQEYNKHVLGRAIPLEQIDRARAEAPTDLYIDHVAAQRRQENVVVSPCGMQRTSWGKSRAQQGMRQCSERMALWPKVFAEVLTSAGWSVQRQDGVSSSAFCLCRVGRHQGGRPRDLHEVFAMGHQSVEVLLCLG